MHCEHHARPPHRRQHKIRAVKEIEPSGKAFHRHGQPQALPEDGQVPIGEGQGAPAEIGRPRGAGTSPPAEKSS
jgi:hypothetical protein